MSPFTPFRTLSTRAVLKLIILGIIATISVFLVFQILILKSSSDSSRSVVFPQFPLPDKCQRLHNIFFLKTIKTGGTTIQKIFYQFGDKYELNFGMPLFDDFLGYPQYLNMSTMSIPVPLNETYNIVANHCRFSRQGAQASMPPDTIYVTLLRDPVSQFKSMYSYFDFKAITKLTIQQFLKLNDQQRNQWPRFGDKFGRNQMAFDLGMSVTDFDNPEAVDSFIKHIEKSFHLVMIAEHMDESILLLRHLLCWSLEDVFHFNFNMRTKCKTSQSPLSAADESEIRRWNAVDQRLYEHFLSVFEKKISEFGRDRLNREFEEFHYWNSLVKKTCVNDSFGEYQGPNCNLILWYNVREEVKEPLCQRLAIMPVAHNDMLRKRQLERVKDINNEILNRQRQIANDKTQKLTEQQ